MPMSSFLGARCGYTMLTVMFSKILFNLISKKNLTLRLDGNIQHHPNAYRQTQDT